MKKLNSNSLINSKNKSDDKIYESKFDKIYKSIIFEATKLNKKEASITDPKELEPLIKKWEDALSGKNVINNAKTGKPLSKKYCQDKLRLLKRKYSELQENNKINLDNHKIKNNEVKSKDDDIKTINNVKNDDSQQSEEKLIKNNLCIKCKTELKPNAKFCGKCGTPVRKCYSCKARVPTTAKFCGKCGEKLSNDISCEVCGAKVSISDQKCKTCGHSLVAQHNNSYGAEEISIAFDKLMELYNKRRKELKKEHDDEIVEIFMKYKGEEQTNLAEKAFKQYMDSLNNLNEEYEKKTNAIKKRLAHAANSVGNDKDLIYFEKEFNKIDNETTNSMEQLILLNQRSLDAFMKASTNGERKNILNAFLKKSNEIQKQHEINNE